MIRDIMPFLRHHSVSVPKRIDTEIAKMEFFLFYISPEYEDMEARSLLNDVDRDHAESGTH